MSTLNKWLLTTLCGVFLWTPGTTTAQQHGAAAVPTELYVRDRYVRLLLLGREGDQLFYRLPDAPAGVQVDIPVAQVQEARFQLEPYFEELREHLDRQDLTSAGRLLYRVVQPSIPYLDLPFNNAVEPALDAAWYLIRTGQMIENPESANRLFSMAENIYRVIARADWHPMANAANVRIAQCQLRRGALEESKAHLDALGEPARGDGVYGLYWLVLGEWHWASGAHREALTAAARASAFENKDVGSFPDALLLAGMAYEAVEEYYRARDVFYEVARLFVGTEWATRAVDKLKRVMATGQTEDAEERDISVVFFGIDRADMNDVVKDFLKELEQAKP